MSVEPYITQEMRERYIERRKQDLERMRAAILERNSETLQNIGHQIKGNAASFEYPELESLAIRLEAAGEAAGKSEDYSTCSAAVEEFSAWLAGR